MVRALFVLLAMSGVASADAPAWRLARVTSGSRDGLTQFQVLRLDARGGEVRIIRSPRDETCPGGATYVIGWRIDGELRRVQRGQALTVSFEGRQTGGANCPSSEPLAYIQSESTGALQLGPGWGPGQFVWFDRPSGRAFYLHPERAPDRHLAQMRVNVPPNAFQPHVLLVIGIDTSGNSGGQWFNAGLLYDAEPPGAPPLAPEPQLPPVRPLPPAQPLPPIQPLPPEQPTAMPPGARASYVGCFVDQDDRDLPDAFMDGNMSIGRCAEHCRNARYFGVQYGNQCFCGNRYGRYGQATDADCNMRCSGNQAQLCGGNWRNSVYQHAGPPSVPPQPPGPARAAYVGCFVDQDDRDLPDAFMDGNMSVERCAEHCRNERYFGVQYGNQCFCGNRYGRYGQAADGDCNMRCSGNQAQLCGGNWRNSVYQHAGAPFIPPEPPQAPPGAAFEINPAWLGTLYYRWGDEAYVLTLAAPNGRLDGRIRTSGPWSDPRHLYNFRLAKPDVLDGEWESDPIYQHPASKRGRKRGTFRAVFYSSSGNTWYILFKEGANSEVEPGAEMNNSWFRERY
ncbi:MAG TPA: WSC domain-containing protein [Polyangia bacterium]|nr:WSC domain-containing protein [Polyangia bacterium]